MIKQLLPSYLKIQWRLLRNELMDRKMGYHRRFAKQGSEFLNYSHTSVLKQDLKPNPAKRHNLELATKAINRVIVEEGALFSFWKIVGNPNKKNGFVASRSIVGNEVKPSIGGGLCQLSGMLYYLSLMMGLEILERHPHSKDIYDEATRFTPLGSDATVVWAYKDLRIRNNTGGAIQFEFLIEENDLILKLHHQKALEKREIQFEKKTKENGWIEVHTIINGKHEVTSLYQKD